MEKEELQEIPRIKCLIFNIYSDSGNAENPRKHGALGISGALTNPFSEQYPPRLSCNTYSHRNLKDRNKKTRTRI